MQKFLQHRKLIGLTVVVSMILLNFTLSPARAVMITTEYAMDQDSKPLSDRARIKAFLARADVMAMLQVYGISHAEALSRADSLTDKEIAALAGRMDQRLSMAGGYEMSGSLWIIGLLIYTIIFFIVFYFSRANIEKEQTEAATTETEKDPQPSNIEEDKKPE